MIQFCKQIIHTHAPTLSFLVFTQQNILESCSPILEEGLYPVFTFYSLWFLLSLMFLYHYSYIYITYKENKS